MAHGRRTQTDKFHYKSDWRNAKILIVAIQGGITEYWLVAEGKRAE